METFCPHLCIHIKKTDKNKTKAIQSHYYHPTLIPQKYFQPKDSFSALMEDFPFIPKSYIFFLWYLFFCQAPSDCLLLLYACSPEFLPPMTSRQEWNWRRETRAIPTRCALPPSWAWWAPACACAWTAATTPTTSGGWWTRQTFSPSEPARGTGTCCSRHWVSDH